MIDPATPKALRVIAAAMREPLYQTDMHGIEALVLDNAAKEIELLGKYFEEANADEVKFRNLWAEAKAENEKLKGAIAAAIKEAAHPYYGDKYLQLRNYEDAILILEKAMEGK